jgi:LCP family protein required for cell wall assembly
VLLALVIGIGIGLLANAYMVRSRPQPVVAEGSAPSTAVPGLPSLSLPKIEVVPQLDRRMTLLLMGVDSNGRNTQRFVNTRSDTMILASIDPETKRVGLVSIPRDSRVKLAGNHGFDKINAAHALGGPELAVDTVKEAFGVPVDHYVVIDVQGLRKLFEVLGPVEVLVEKRMRYTDHAGRLKVTLDPGLQQLTPEQAEEYVRFRHDPRGDIGRIDRQQWFLRQVSKKLREPAVVLKLPGLFQLANDYVVTDLPIEDMAKLANFAKDIKPSQVTTATLPGEATCIKGGSYWLPSVEADAVVFNRLLGVPISNELARETSSPVISQDVHLAPSAMAAESNGETDPKPVSITIRYPKGAELTAKHLEHAVNEAGFYVRYKVRGEMSDCQHEQIVQSSYRADDYLTQKLKDKVPVLAEWPINVIADPHASTDITLIVSPTTEAPPTAAEAEEEAKEAAATASAQSARPRHTRRI